MTWNLSKGCTAAMIAAKKKSVPTVLIRDRQSELIALTGRGAND